MKWRLSEGLGKTSKKAPGGLQRSRGRSRGWGGTFPTWPPERGLAGPLGALNGPRGLGWVPLNATSPQPRGAGGL